MTFEGAAMSRVRNFSVSLDGFLEALQQQYVVEAVSTPSGVTHLTFTR